MPSRRRHQEWKRRYRRAAEEVEAQELAALRLGLLDPLDDAFWLSHERGEWCCPSCDYNHPGTIKAAAQAEIKEFKRGG